MDGRDYLLIPMVDTKDGHGSTRPYSGKLGHMRLADIQQDTYGTWVLLKHILHEVGTASDETVIHSQQA